MRLLLIRHAHAGKRNPIHFPDDTLRPVSEKGRAVQERVGEYLVTRELVPTTLYTSPWLRALETAEILAEIIARRATQPTIVPFPLLATAPNLRAISSAVGKQPPQAVLGFVGHEPWLGQFAAALLAGSASAMAVDFPKSGVLGVETNSIGRGKGILRFFLRPGMAAGTP